MSTRPALSGAERDAEIDRLSREFPGRKRGTREQVRACDQARRALQDYGERARKARVREETPEYHRLNSRVLETEQPLSSFQRAYAVSDLREVRDAWRGRRKTGRSR